MVNYYVWRSADRGFSGVCETKTRFYKVIDKFHTIVLHVEINKINVIRTSSFKQNVFHNKPGEVTNTIYGPWIYLRHTTEKLFNYYYNKIRKENYRSYESICD